MTAWVEAPLRRASPFRVRNRTSLRPAYRDDNKGRRQPDGGT